MIVFRPFVGEILVGWVSSCTEEGINVKMEFFDDIHIPKSLLFEECSFVPREQAWLWKTEESELYIDTNEKIRFRVEQEIFSNQPPKRPGVEEEEQVHNQVPPYSIIGSCQTDGMGLVSWWE
ncbi:DNA-directed RNA polymerase III subunit RPC25 [Sugiyamaella lignohabitans]|uniref:DNA-directed RNA polymerase subunit n=1 Tax=Sugiyamaella lignohabitans TaxID=796027 RepID=A0A167E815_9ASCO|nr:DNA-directed RNA polymerase III subunit RPC25 [Sugiyamaella lignohabitans]ANB13754.1 DNA-directed RNA polymerase III subunit RPC25 [Sugiyamaella lignohabitans]